MREFQLHGEEDFIKLGQLLKAEGLVDSGVEAKYAIVAFGGEEIRVR